MYNVIIGKDEAVRGDEDAGTRSALHPLVIWGLHPGMNTDHCRPYDFSYRNDRPGVGVEKLYIGLRIFSYLAAFSSRNLSSEWFKHKGQFFLEIDLGITAWMKIT